MSILQMGESSIHRMLYLGVFAIILLALVAGCGAARPNSGHEGHDASTHDSGEHDSGEHSEMMETTIDGLTISKAMAAGVPLAGGNGAVYLTLSSDTADQLVSVESPAAGMVELHESIDDNGVLRMEPRPDGFEIPAGGEVELKRGGKHIMLLNLTDALEAGGEVEVTLNFRESDSVTIMVPIMEMGAMDH